MKHLRLKASIHLNRDHVIPESKIEAIRVALERAIASELPQDFNVDTVKVTSFKEVTQNENDDQ